MAEICLHWKLLTKHKWLKGRGTAFGHHIGSLYTKCNIIGEEKIIYER